MEDSFQIRALKPHTDRTYLLSWKPSGILNLILVHFDVSGRGDGMAANHEAGGHRPGLAGHILDWTNLHPALLLHLPPHRLLNGLPCVRRGGG